LFVVLAVAGCGGKAAPRRPALPTAAAPGSVARLPCPANPVTTVELESCSARRLLRLNAAVNTQTAALWSLRGSEGRRRISAAERAWQAYVEDDCTSRSGIWISPGVHTYAGGSAAPVAYSECKERLTAAHAQDLASAVVDLCTGRVATGACLAMRSGGRTYVLHEGDEAIVPAINQVCTASGEGGAPDLFCARPKNPHHQVVIFNDEILIWKNGDTDTPAWTGKP
jgi:uncharacterized protein YecT (DUF1311 family)